MRARNIASAVNSGKVSAEAVARDTLALIADYDRVQPQAWISRFPDAEVLAAARAVDAAVRNGEDLPLAGVPFAVKDNIDVAGLATTAACPAFAYQPAADATVVARLRAAGAVCLGKTNLDQFATGLNGTRSPYGAPACVFNLAYVSGGSSSGSAVVVAAGLVAFALGTDTAGSGRVPAAFNGLVGLKPSKGRWSTAGLVPACRSLDCISLFTRDAEDADLIDRIATAYDPADPFSRTLPDRPVGRRIGVPPTTQCPWFGDLQAEHLYHQAQARLAGQGHTLVEVDLAPLLAAARLLYEGPWVAERTAALEPILAASPEAIDPTVREIVEQGRGFTAIDLFRAQYQLADHARAAAMLWQQVDCLALPTAPTIYRIAELRANPVALNSHFGTWTNFVNLLDMAAIAVPAGYRHNATGFGITFMAPAGSDRALLELARQWGQPSPPPSLDRPTAESPTRMETIRLAVVGAHLEGMPLHWQLTSRNAKFVGKAETAPSYRLYAMAGSVPPKPALVHDESGGEIALEIYELEAAAFGSFVAEVPPPLAIGTVTLADGSSVKGFVAEPRALTGATDITALGGWRAYIATL
jgi:allophanate hydrolase